MPCKVVWKRVDSSLDKNDDDDGCCLEWNVFLFPDDDLCFSSVGSPPFCFADPIECVGDGGGEEGEVVVVVFSILTIFFSFSLLVVADRECLCRE